MSKIENTEETVERGHGSPKFDWKAGLANGTVIGAVIGATGGFTPVGQHMLSNNAADLALLNRFIRNRNTLMRVHGTLFGGALMGVYWGSYIGVHNYLAKKRGVRDVYNLVGGSAAAAAAVGFTAPGVGPLPYRAKKVMLLTLIGSVLGSTLKLD